MSPVNQRERLQTVETESDRGTVAFGFRGKVILSGPNEHQASNQHPELNMIQGQSLAECNICFGFKATPFSARAYPSLRAVACAGMSAERWPPPGLDCGACEGREGILSAPVTDVLTA